MLSIQKQIRHQGALSSFDQSLHTIEMNYQALFNTNDINPNLATLYTYLYCVVVDKNAHYLRFLFLNSTSTST